MNKKDKRPGNGLGNRILCRVGNRWLELMKRLKIPTAVEINALKRRVGSLEKKISGLT